MTSYDEEIMEPSAPTTTMPDGSVHLLTKLDRVRKKIGTPTKDSKNPHYGNQYLSLPGLLEIVEPALSEERLSMLTLTEGQFIWLHLYDLDTGFRVSGYLKMKADIPPQDTGSSLTYYRRYLIETTIGIRAEDDDGQRAQAASKPWCGTFKTSAAPAKPQQLEPHPPATAEREPGMDADEGVLVTAVEIKQINYKDPSKGTFEKATIHTEDGGKYVTIFKQLIEWARRAQSEGRRVIPVAEKNKFNELELKSLHEVRA